MTTSAAAVQASAPVEARDLTFAPTVARYMLSPARVRVIVGPLGWGKTFGMFWELMRLMHAQRADTHGLRRSRWAVVRGSYPKLTDTTVVGFKEVFPQSNYHIRLTPVFRADVGFPCPDGTTVEAEVRFLAMDQPEDLDKVKSMNLTGVVVNELSEIQWPHFSALVERIGRYPPVDPADTSGEPSITRICVIADTNKSGDDSWLYRMCEVKTPENWEFFVQPGALIKDDDGGYRPNPLAENVDVLRRMGNSKGGYGYYLDNLEAMLLENPARVDVLYCNQWGFVTGGKPVFEKSFDNEIHCPRRGVRHDPDVPKVYAGFDFGLTPAVVIAQWTGRSLRVFAEIVGDNIGVAPFLTDFYLPWMADELPHIQKGSVVNVGDSSGRFGKENTGGSAFDEFRALSLSITGAPTRSPEALHAAGRWMMRGGTALRPQLVIDRGRCPKLVTALARGYQFRKINAAGSERYSDKVAKDAHSHVAEAFLHLCAHLKIGYDVAKVVPLFGSGTADEDPASAPVAGY